MATITASLERSLQNCSLNQMTTTATTTSSRSSKGAVRSSSSDSPNQRRRRHHEDGHQSVSQSNASSSDDNSAFVDLNSHLSLPYHWEQCLDLKTGEIYYINWSNGMKAKEDPRTTCAAAGGVVGDSYYSEEDEEEEEEEEEENESSSIHNSNNNGCNSEGDGEGYSTCSSTSTRESFRSIKNQKAAASVTHVFCDDDEEEDDQGHGLSSDSILVVAGCKSCLMYYMLPKHALDCPKCSGQLLHFPDNHKPS